MVIPYAHLPWEVSDYMTLSTIIHLFCLSHAHLQMIHTPSAEIISLFPLMLHWRWI